MKEHTKKVLSYKMSIHEKILDASNFDFTNSTIIKPPFKQPSNMEVGKQFTRVVIDSRDRNLTLYPSASKYVFYLNQDVEEVTSGEVIVVNVPFSNYNINTYNNTFTINVSSNDINIEIPEGNYTGTTLAATITSLVQIASGMSALVTFDMITEKLVWSQCEFSLQCTTKQGSNVLGIEQNVVYNLFVEGGFISNWKVNLSETNSCIIMCIDNFTINNSSNSVIDRSTAILYPIVTMLNYVSTPSVLIKKYFNPPIGRMARISITFKDYYGNPYNFRNKEHVIEILFESRKNLNKYAHYV